MCAPVPSSAKGGCVYRQSTTSSAVSDSKTMAMLLMWLISWYARALGMEHLACRTVLTQQLLERCCGFFEGDGALARTLEASERVQEQERLVWGAQAARLPRLDAADLLQPVIP